MGITTASIIFVILILILIISLSKTLTESFFSLFDNQVSRSRLRKFNKNIKEDDKSNLETVESITSPVIKNLFPKLQDKLPSLQIDNLEKLNKELKFIGWDDSFTAETYIAFNIVAKILGVVAFLILATMDTTMLITGIFVALILFFALDIAFKAEIKKRNDLLFIDFPDLIRIVSGYLISGMDLVRAMEESTKYVSDEWKPILNRFSLNCKSSTVSDALDVFKESIDMFEVREFISLVKLTLEQGGDAKESFVKQADKIAVLKKNQLLMKISKRKIMGLALMGPGLLANMTVIMVPILINATSVL